MRFVTKGVVMTCGVSSLIDQELTSYLDLAKLLEKHFENQGDECKYDKKLNEDAIESKDGRVVSCFNKVTENNKDIWVITEGLHLADDPLYGNEYPITTILLPTEY